MQCICASFGAMRKRDKRFYYPLRTGERFRLPALLPDVFPGRFCCGLRGTEPDFPVGLLPDLLVWLLRDVLLFFFAGYFFETCLRLLRCF